MTSHWRQVLEGESLLLRPLAESDREELAEVASDPLIWEQHPIDTRWRADIFAHYFDHLLENNCAMAVTDKAAGSIVGSSSFSNIRTDAVEIGSTFLARTHWGGRSNQEMKRLMLAHAFEQVPTVEFLIGEENWRSRKAVEKIGAKLTERTHLARFDDREIIHLIYEITRDDFASGPLSS